MLVMILTCAAIFGSGVVGGIFFGFSSFVMSALARLPRGEGVRAMQSINVAVLNPVFLGLFVGTAVIDAGLAVMAYFRWGTPGSNALLAGGLLYAVGCFGVTMVCNVPLNEELARVDADSPAGRVSWERYLRTWVIWNHVRTGCSLLAAGVLIYALRQVSR